MNVYIMSNHVSERMSIVRRESMADIPLKDRIGSVSWRVAEDCRKEEAWRRVWQRRKRRRWRTAHGWLLHTRQLPRIQQSGRMQDADTLWIMKPSASMPVWLLLANARSLLSPTRNLRICSDAFLSLAATEMRPSADCVRLSALMASNFNCVKTTIHGA